MKSSNTKTKPEKKSSRKQPAAAQPAIAQAAARKPAASTSDGVDTIAIESAVAKTAAQRAAAHHRVIPAPHLAAQRGMYADVLDYLAQQESSDIDGSDLRETLSADAIRQLRVGHPGVPQDYLQYLSEVGWGTFLGCRYTIYPRLVPLEIRVGAPAAEQLPDRVLCFGDDLSGGMAGFLPERDWVVITIGHADLVIDRTGLTFGEFIRERMSMDC